MTEKSEFLIRPCADNDIDAILVFEREWEEEAIAHVFVPISREDLIAGLAQFPSYFLVAESDGHIVGYVNGSVHLGTESTIIPAQEPYLMVENLYVTPAFRHRQVGGQLIERLLEAARHQGLERCSVDSDSKQIEKILAFYQSHGFKLWHVQLYK